MTVKMKRLSILLLSAAALLTGCESRLDIVPAGMTTFTTADELESLINQQWRVYDWDLDFTMLCNQTYPSWGMIDEIYSVNQSVKHAFYFCDESVDRVDLTDTDERYNELYRHIYYTNIVISKMDEVSGDAAKKTRLVAEARILRAWFHFLLANFYAGQYDAATAAQTGGIAYNTNTDSGSVKEKLNLQQVYDLILEDCTDDVIAQLKQNPDNDPCRFEADFGYGVRARVLFQMKRYDEAVTYARKALAVNSAIDDRTSILSKGTWEKPFDADDVYLFINSNSVTNSCTLNRVFIAPELEALFEEGDLLRNFSQPGEWYTYEDMFGYGIPGVSYYQGSSARINVFGLDAENMYYVVGEGLVMTGHVDEGLDMIDRVRIKRIHSDFYQPLKGRFTTESAAVEALQRAKRTEFITSFEHYFDCKRLNSDPRYASTIVRDCAQYGTRDLKPDSKLWIYPFPMNATNFNSTLTQNY